jgi:hypothetical protein
MDERPEELEGGPEHLREIVALGEKGEKPNRELFERFDMHLRNER